MLQNRPKSQIETIQVYRGLAALGVVLYHVQLIGRQRLGASFGGELFMETRAGVDFFFVLSGFIMTYVHASDIGDAARVRDYAMKRFIRIYPLLFVLTVGKICAMFVFPTLVGEHQLSLSLIVNSLLMLPQDRVPILPPAWTLSHEALFYLMFGVGIVIGQRGWRLIQAIWWCGIIVMGVKLTMVENEQQIDLLPRFLFHPHNMEFLVGCLLAAAVQRWPPRPRFAMRLVILSMTLAAIKVTVLFDQQGTLASCFLWSGCFACLLWAGLAWEQNSSQRPPAFLRYVGDASYSVYLLNTPLVVIGCWVLARLHLAAGWPIQLGLSGVVVGSVLVGFLCYELIERPIVRGLRSRWL